MGQNEKLLSRSNMNVKPWGGRFKANLDSDAETFSASISVDKELALYDINGSLTHIEMLNKQGILTDSEYNSIKKGLLIIEDEVKANKFAFDDSDEDVHMAIEKRLIKLIGPIGGKIHTARSRNDQVVLDVKLYLKDKITYIKKLLLDLLNSIILKAQNNIDIIMPGYTHLQIAQPVLFSHYFLAYYEMFKRDYERFLDCYKRLNYCPLGSAALAGTNFNIDRFFVAEKLDFSSPTSNSIDTVSDRDYIIELLSTIAISMMHLSRMSEDFIIYATKEFSFLTLSDKFTTGSSIMPQKKNPDMLELIRGKSAKAYGCLISLLVLLKGLPLSYNRDLQEDKKPLFDAINDYSQSLNIMKKIIDTAKLNKEKMAQAAQSNYSTATDLADYLTLKGMPFRDAHRVVGNIVLYASERGKDLIELSLEEYKDFSDIIESDIYEYINIHNSINRKNSYGGTSKKQVEEQINVAKKFIDANKI
jgi:argininosuccinate lyase